MPLANKSQSKTIKVNDVSETINETDGLVTGEVGWIMGNKYSPDGKTHMNHMAFGGMGFGVDRMQRLCTTKWNNERLNVETNEKTHVDLTKMTIYNNISKQFVDEINTHRIAIAGATVLGAVDVPQVYKKIGGGRDANETLTYYTGNPTNDEITDGTYKADTFSIEADTTQEVGYACGLFVREEGPFLRGKMISDDLVTVPDPFRKNADKTFDLPRNYGDVLAFESLYATLRVNGIFDWKPDGIVLSKLESPAGDTMASTEIDARQAQLFNVAVQGPAITKAWSGNSTQQSMPMDRVFIVLVAEVQTKLGVKGQNDVKSTWGRLKNVKDATKDTINATLESIENADNTEKIGGNEIGKATDTTKDQWKVKIDDNWRDRSEEFRRGERGVINCTMSNFQWKTMTASYLNQYSYYRPGSDTSRCGLKICQTAAEYIIGGWCIGTVIDNAASRASVGNQTRIAPASMAINVNVGVEWWSGDKLYKNYMDVDGTVLMREAVPKNHGAPAEKSLESPVNAAKRRRNAGMDVSNVNKKERGPGYGQTPATKVLDTDLENFAEAGPGFESYGTGKKPPSKAAQAVRTTQVRGKR